MFRGPRDCCLAGVLLAGWLLVTTGGLRAEVPYRATFEDGGIGGWEGTGGTEMETTLVPRDAAAPAAGHCLSVSGRGVWLSAVVALPEPVTLDPGPVYVTADIHSSGPCGEVRLSVAAGDEYNYHRTGPMSYDARENWVRAVWSMAGFYADYIDGKVVVDRSKPLDGLKLSQRIAGGYDQGPDGPARHELRVDNVEVHTGADALRVAAECAARAAQRAYVGPQAFRLGQVGDLRIWHAPSTAKIFRDHEPPPASGSGIEIALARNEAESFQIVLKSASRRDRLWLRLSPLTSADGARTLDALAWYWHPVHYVPITARAGIPVDQWWPEPLSWDRNVRLEPDRAQALWVTLDVPARTAPGNYSGTLDLLSEAEHLLSVPVSVTVWNFTLPQTPTFRTNQQLWAAGERRRQMTDLLARCRQYDGHALGQLGRDFLVALMNRGQNALKLSLPVGHQGFTKRKPPRIRLGTNEDGTTKWAEICTPEFEEAFAEKLAKEAEWYRERGWLKHAFVYLWDEPWADPEVYDMILWYGRLVKRLAPELKTLVAAAYEPRLDGVVDIFLSYSSPDVMQAARRKGIEFWWWGNAAFDVSMCAIDQRLRFGFESFQKGYSGSYAWGLGLWTQSNNRRRKPEPYDVWTQPQRANKSCTVLYPGGVWQSKDVRVAPSLSLEITRDGIEDYEYIGLLQARHAALKNRSSDTAKAIEALLERARTFYVAPPPQRSDFDAVDALSKLRRDIAAALTQ